MLLRSSMAASTPRISELRTPQTRRSDQRDGVLSAGLPSRARAKSPSFRSPNAKRPQPLQRRSEPVFQRDEPDPSLLLSFTQLLAALIAQHLTSKEKKEEEDDEESEQQMHTVSLSAVVSVWRAWRRRGRLHGRRRRLRGRRRITTLARAFARFSRVVRRHKYRFTPAKARGIAEDYDVQRILWMKRKAMGVWAVWCGVKHNRESRLLWADDMHASRHLRFDRRDERRALRCWRVYSEACLFIQQQVHVGVLLGARLSRRGELRPQGGRGRCLAEAIRRRTRRLG